MASKKDTPNSRRSRYFTAVDSSSVKTVAEKHRFSAYHNKH